MVGYGQVASMQEPAFNITTSSFIDIPATLLQSEPAGAANGTFLTVVCCLAAIAGWVIWRRRLTQVPRDASGRLPQDALLGVVAMMLFYVAGALGALVIGERMDPSDPYGRLARGALGNAAQVALAVALIRSPLFVDAERPPARPRDALAAGGIGFLLALPIVLALGAAIGLLMTALGFPPPPATSHETLRILLEKGEAVFTLLTLAHVALLVPIAEEAGWRGILQPSLRKAGLGGTGAALATAVLFAAIHWSVMPPDSRVAGLAMLVTLGFALGLLRERTGGILAPIVLHALFNAWNVVLTLARSA
jgi:membrane protease YdiL (CAAX protease family)